MTRSELKQVVQVVYEKSSYWHLLNPHTFQGAYGLARVVVEETLLWDKIEVFFAGYLVGTYKSFARPAWVDVRFNTLRGGLPQTHEDRARQFINANK